MQDYVLEKWQTHLSRKKYFQNHFLHIQPKLGEELVSALRSNPTEVAPPSLSSALHRIVDCTTASQISQHDLFDSLFRLRDIIQYEHFDSIGERTILKRNLEQAIVRISALMERQSEEVKSAFLQIAANGEIDSESLTVELDGSFKIVGLSTRLLERLHATPETILDQPFELLFSANSQNILRNATAQIRDRKRMITELDLEVSGADESSFQAIVKLQAHSTQPDAGYTADFYEVVRGRNSQEKLALASSLLDNIREGVVVIEPKLNGKIVYANDGMANICGKSSASLIGSPLSIISGAGYSTSKSLDVYEQAINGCWSGGFEVEVRNKSTQVLPATFYAYHSEKGDVEALFGVIQPPFRNSDVKNTIRDELLRLERLQAVSTVAFGLAHDFNNLLATVLGRAQLMLQKGPSAEQSTQLQAIERAAKDGAAIIKQLQALTRDRSTEPAEAVNLDTVIRESLQYIKPHLERAEQLHGNNIQVGLSGETDSGVLAKETDLKQVITNLFLNAVDAMPNGGTIEIQVTKANEDQVAFRLRDSGEGMDAEIVPSIFDPFFSTRGVGRTGLGLSLVHNIIHGFGGKIIVESEPGEGTEFTILLPATDIPSQQPSSRNTAEAGRRDLKILVVDDDAEILATIVEVLRLKFDSVDMAASGQQALATIAHQHYDVVLTDLGMPGMSGWELAAKIKESTAETKVILVTGWDHANCDDSGKTRHVDCIVKKPYDLNDIFSTIDRLCHS